jgi:hypothetical protein
MAVTTTNVLVGNATLYTAPANTAAPADTLADGAAWLTPWVHVGGTEEGVSFAVGVDTNDIRIEEQSTPVLVTVNQRNVRIMAALSEDTIENMKLAYGGGTIATQAAAAGVIGKKTLTLSESLDSLAAGFEGKSPQGFFRRVYIPRIISVADVTTVYRRAAGNRSYAVEFRAICPIEQITITDKTAAATA